MNHAKKLKTSRIVRFLIVGAGNTAINFAVLNFAFFGLDLNKVVSSVIATTCAIIFSFVMNRSFVFGDRERPFQKFLIFTVVSAGGVLAIQTSVYVIGILLLRHNANFVAINLSNLGASLCVMLWNYNGYRLFVFNGTKAARLGGNEISEADESA